MTSTVWELEDFLARYDEWLEREDPPDDWRVAVMAWVHSLQSDPYRSATRRLDLGIDKWFAEIPEAGDDDQGVFSLYSVSEPNHNAKCDVITALRYPTPG